MVEKYPKKLVITWESSSPPAKAKRQIELDLADLAVEKQDSKLESRLCWPKETIAVLRRAFEKGFGRFDGWQTSEHSEAAEVAASVFKRGVEYTQAKKRIRNARGSYQITFVAEKDLKELFSVEDTCVFVDENVYKKWKKFFSEKKTHIVKIDEITKTLKSAAKICDLGKNNKRWIAVGGGVLCDTAAFAASQRGAQITLIPTTLLAMADACVVGKTGVNFEDCGKNQVGAFFFPAEVLVWEGWLETLSDREFLSGLSECFKHAYLSGKRELIKSLVKVAKRRGKIKKYLAEIISVKMRVVEEDPLENGKRAILNFGHTLGHALETYSQRENPKKYLLHGEAVAYGMAFATHLSRIASGLPEEDAKLVLQSLKKSGSLQGGKYLAKRLGAKSLDSQDLWIDILKLLGEDKKASMDKVKWVLLERLGKPVAGDGSFTTSIDKETLSAAWRYMDRLY